MLPGSNLHLHSNGDAVEARLVCGVLKPRPSTLVVGGVGVLFVALTAAIVARSLVRPELESFVPSPVRPADVGAGSLGPTLYTLDATAHDEWVYFDFSRRSVIPDAARRSLDWDLAFQRHRILTNGGATNPAGEGGVLDLGPQPLESVFEVPLTGYVTDERPGDASRNRVLEDWYDYSWTSHILTPSDRTYAIRTADGRYAALRFVAYYCPGARPGCVTFLYAYRGDRGRGGRRFPPK